jgi:hypothetical protein
LICALPLATDVPAAKPPRKAPVARKAKTPAPVEIEAEPTPEPEPVAGFTAGALAALAEPTTEPEAPIAPPALDPVAAKREKKTIAQRLRRAAAKAAVQWRGDEAMTAAAE